MKRSYKIGILLLALSVSAGTFWACKRTVKNGEILGNNALKPAPSDFSGITNAGEILDSMARPGNLSYPRRINGFTPPLNYAQGDYLFLSNTFSHEVTWFVNLKGRLTGATKSFTGTSNQINSTNFKWSGEADGYTFFVGNDIVDYTLSFLGSSIVYKDSVALSGNTNLYNGIKLLPNGDTLFYYKIDDFETAGGIQTSYSDAADGAQKAVFYVNDEQSVNGFFQYYMKGTDNNSNNYCGGASNEALDGPIPGVGIIPEDDPSKVFINAYIYGYGRPNSALFFQVFENDNATPPAFPFPLRDKTKNDMWYTIIEVNWTGWKLVSVPYSSFKPASDPLSGGGGNRIKEPRKISAFGIELESYPTPGNTVELGLDLITITRNAPFQP